MQKVDDKPLEIGQFRQNFLLNCALFRTMKTAEKQRVLIDLKSKREIDELKKRLCLLMEQDIILGVGKVTLDVSWNDSE